MGMACLPWRAVGPQRGRNRLFLGRFSRGRFPACRLRPLRHSAWEPATTTFLFPVFFAPRDTVSHFCTAVYCFPVRPVPGKRAPPGPLWLCRPGCQGSAGHPPGALDRIRFLFAGTLSFLHTAPPRHFAGYSNRRAQPSHESRFTGPFGPG